MVLRKEDHTAGAKHTHELHGPFANLTQKGMHHTGIKLYILPQKITVNVYKQ
jgi:hypothetical protein